jgi:hypothetical protein
MARAPVSFQPAPFPAAGDVAREGRALFRAGSAEFCEPNFQEVPSVNVGNFRAAGRLS